MCNITTLSLSRDIMLKIDLFVILQISEAWAWVISYFPNNSNTNSEIIIEVY